MHDVRLSDLLNIKIITHPAKDALIFQPAQEATVSNTRKLTHLDLTLFRRKYKIDYNTRIKAVTFQLRDHPVKFSEDHIERVGLISPRNMFAHFDHAIDHRGADYPILVAEQSIDGALRNIGFDAQSSDCERTDTPLAKQAMSRIDYALATLSHGETGISASSWLCLDIT